MPSNSAPPDQWSGQDKVQAVLETAALSQAELSAYCRKHGLYPEQIERWKAACVAGNDSAEAQTRQQAKTHRQDQKRIRRLEAEVRRKDAALAETAALLTLSKNRRERFLTPKAALGVAARDGGPQKSRGDPGPQQRGRLTSLPDRQHAVALVREAQDNGARLAPACAVLGISARTLQRWTQDETVASDRRPTAPRPTPTRKYSPEERQAMRDLCHRPDTRAGHRPISWPINWIKAIIRARPRRSIACCMSMTSNNTAAVRPRRKASGPL